MDKQLVVTPIESLVEYAGGTIVELPPFGPDQPFVARLRRPSMLALAKAGKIPNTLLTAANRLFFGDENKSGRDVNALEKTLDVIDVLCEAAFIEPTYQQLKDCGIQLSDDQYMFVFNFTQNGVNALHSFRGEQGDIENNTDGESV